MTQPVFQVELAREMLDAHRAPRHAGARRRAPARELQERRVPPQRGARDADPRADPRAHAQGGSRRRRAQGGHQHRSGDAFRRPTIACRAPTSCRRSGNTSLRWKCSTGSRAAEPRTSSSQSTPAERSDRAARSMAASGSACDDPRTQVTNAHDRSPRLTCPMSQATS